MQLKTIKKTITNKLNEWLETITDEALRKQVKKNTLVSGGSITSMLLNEPVNDYDIYLMHEEVLFKLTQYYTRDYTQGNQPEIEILRGKAKNELYQKYEENRGGHTTPEADNNQYAIAIRNLKDDQIKLFFNDTKGGKRVNEDKKPEELNYQPVYFSPNAISLSNQIQIVIRFHGNAQQIHSTFDFIHATNYFTFDEGLVTNKEALESIITKQLKYQGSLYPVTTIIRIKKFLKRHWNINAGEMLKVMFQISELDLKNMDVLEDQLTGIDVAYFSTLIEILRGVESEKLSAPYINSIIDKVFNEYEEEDEPVRMPPTNNPVDDLPF